MVLVCIIKLDGRFVLALWCGSADASTEVCGCSVPAVRFPYAFASACCGDRVRLWGAAKLASYCRLL